MTNEFPGSGSFTGRLSPVIHHSSVGDALRWAAQELGLAGVESARMTAELLLAHVLGWIRVRVITHPEASLSTGQAERFCGLVLRRCAGEPLQYITGEREFYGLPFKVTPSVLIPRPETEFLVGEALRLSKNLQSLKRVRFADVGTGSGCIAITLLHILRGWEACATDKFPAALEIARQNAVKFGVEDRIQFVCSDLLESFPERRLFDLILSNPPYGARAEFDAFPATVRDYEPEAAVFGGASGYEIFTRLIPEAAARLIPGGHLLLEVGAGQMEEVAGMAERAGLLVVRAVEDLQGIERCLVVRRHG